MTPPDRRTREKAATREKILAAARELFVRDGFEAVSMRKIAEAIEYTAPALYVHFPDKHSLLLALCDQDFSTLRDAVRIVEHEPHPVERLRLMGRAYVDFALEHPHHYRFMFMTTLPEAEKVAASAKCGSIERGDPDQDGYAHLRKVVGECISGGYLRPEYTDEHRMTQMFWGAVHGVVSLYITHGNDPWVEFKDPRETAHLLVDASLAGTLKAPEAFAHRTTKRTLKQTARSGVKTSRTSKRSKRSDLEGNR